MGKRLKKTVQNLQFQRIQTSIRIGAGEAASNGLVTESLLSNNFREAVLGGVNRLVVNAHVSVLIHFISPTYGSF